MLNDRDNTKNNPEVKQTEDEALENLALFCKILLEIDRDAKNYKKQLQD